VVVPFTGIDTSEQSFFSFIPAWYTVNNNKAERGAASGGTQLRIAGIGFDARSKVYSCRFTREQGDRGESLSSPALAQNATLLTCLTPPWGLKYATANVTLSVFHGEQEVANRDAAPKAQLPPIPLSQSCLTVTCASFSYEYFTVWEVADLKTGPVGQTAAFLTSSPFGGRLLTLSGYGFSSAESYLCGFGSEQHNATSSALILNVSTLTCRAPTWPVGNQIVKVSLYYYHAAAQPQRDNAPLPLPTAAAASGEFILEYTTA
jgi:hypothetical protein